MWVIIPNAATKPLARTGWTKDVFGVSLGDRLHYTAPNSYIHKYPRLPLKPLRPLLSQHCTWLLLCLITVSPGPVLGEPVYSSGLPPFALWVGMEQSKV